MATAMVTGVTRSYHVALEDVGRVLDARPGEMRLGLSIAVMRERTVFIADSTVTELPTPRELADIACQSAAKAREMGHEPRVALLSFSTYGNPLRERGLRVREAIEILDSRGLDFEYDGEIAADVALNEALRELYPFCRLSGPANVLVMPALHSANISTKLLQELGGGTLVGPLLMGMEKPVQIVPLGATVSDIVNFATFAAHEAIRNRARVHSGLTTARSAVAPCAAPALRFRRRCSGGTAAAALVAAGAVDPAPAAALWLAVAVGAAAGLWPRRGGGRRGVRAGGAPRGRGTGGTGAPPGAFRTRGAAAPRARTARPRMAGRGGSARRAPSPGTRRSSTRCATRCCCWTIRASSSSPTAPPGRRSGRGWSAALSPRRCARRRSSLPPSAWPTERSRRVSRWAPRAKGGASIWAGSSP